MSTIFNSKKIQIQTAKIIFSLVLGLGMVFGFNLAAFGAFNSTTQRYEDVLTSPHQEATYTYYYENTAPDAAPGYFEMVIETLGLANPQDQIQINSITESYPIDGTTYANLSNTQTTNVVVSQASYVSNNTIVIRFAPQNTCTPRVGGGCDNALIPAAVPGKITIKASLKTSAATGTNILQTINSKIYFPNGYDINSVQWRITTNYQKTDAILDPSIQGVAAIKGQGGTGNPIVGQPYTVVVSGITAVTGNPLQAPNGTCTTVIGGTTYTGTGITNGNCTINIPVNATSTVPGGTANVSDGGSPISITQNNIPYTSVTADSYLTDSDIPGLTVSCNSAVVNSTTTCNFNLPANKLLPANFKMGINDATPAGTCVAAGGAGSAVTCTAVPTGTTVGTQPIFGQIDTNAKVDTGETVLITAAALTSADIPGITFTCDVAPINSTTTCSFVMPANKGMPTSLTLGIGDSTPAGTCTLTNGIVTCVNVPTGTLVGDQPIFAKVATDPKTDSLEKVYVMTSTDFYKGDIVYTPNQGSTAPLFRSSDTVNIRLTNFNTILDQLPVDGTYACKFEIRPYQANSSSTAWTAIASNVSYTQANGCAANFLKSQRGNGLNWSVKVTVSNNTNPNQTYDFGGESYIFRFEGAGVASGN